MRGWNLQNRVTPDLYYWDCPRRQAIMDVATVDTEEWKVIGVWKVARGFFERGEEIK